jgi:O-antigen/teichoic acid export membrane protein
MSIDHKRNQRDIAVGAAANYGGFLFRLSVRLPFLFLAGMLFGAEHYGEYIFATSFIEAIGVLCCLGFKRSIFGFLEESEVYDDPREAARLLTACWKLTLIAAMGCAGLVFIFAKSIAVLLNSPEVAHALRYLCWALPLIVTIDLFLSGCRFRRKVRYEVIARSMTEPVVLTLAAIILYLLGFTESGLLYAYITALTATCATAAYGLHKSYTHPEFASFAAFPTAIALLRRAAPTGIYEFLKMVLDRLHIIIVTFFFSESVTGVYGAAVQFTTLLNKIGAGFEPILAPVVAQLTNRDSGEHLQHQLAKIVRWVMSIEFLLVVLFVLFGRDMLSAIGEEFVAGEHIMWILVCAVAVQSAFMCNDLPVVYRHPSRNLLIVLILLGICAESAYVLAPKFGPIGVAMALLLTHVCGAIFSSLLIRHLFSVWPFEFATFKPLISLVVGISVGYFSLSLGAPKMLSVLLIIFCYVATAYQFSATSDERNWIRQKLGGVLRGAIKSPE